MRGNVPITVLQTEQHLLRDPIQTALVCQRELILGLAPEVSLGALRSWMPRLIAYEALPILHLDLRLLTLLARVPLFQAVRAGHIFLAARRDTRRDTLSTALRTPIPCLLRLGTAKSATYEGRQLPIGHG